MPQRQRGFTIVELVSTLSVLLILSTLGTFTLEAFLRSYRASGDARQLESQISLARLRASSAFTRTRFNVDLAARSYRIELCTNKTNSCGEWQTEGGTYFLSPGVDFGFGSISTPAGEQTTIGQSAGDSGSVMFNSRGVPVDTDGAPTSNNAIYVTNSANDLFYAVTVSRTGLVSFWQYNSTTSQWEAR